MDYYERYQAVLADVREHSAALDEQLTRFDFESAYSTARRLHRLVDEAMKIDAACEHATLYDALQAAGLVGS